MRALDPSQIGYSEIYKLMIGLIVPRPIAFVSSLDPAGIRNLALYNVEATGEFVVNIVSEEIAAQMNAASAEVPLDVDEFVLSGLTPIASDLVKPPRVAESKAQMECRLIQTIHVSDKPGGGVLVLGEVLRFHVLESVLDGFKIDPDELRAIGRMGGPTYVRTSDRFDMQRPK
jgi:flavin reductase (DIM6/NTAB) family NADH-FMN oxidoreductase RutF